MKKLLITPLVTLAFSTADNDLYQIGNTCADISVNDKTWNDNLTVSQLDEFHEGGFTIVQGDIIIRNNKALTSLKLLSNLKKCEEHFFYRKASI